MLALSDGTLLFGSDDVPSQPVSFRIDRNFPGLLRPKPEPDATVRTPAPAGFTPTDEAP